MREVFVFFRVLEVSNFERRRERKPKSPLLHGGGRRRQRERERESDCVTVTLLVQERSIVVSTPSVTL